MAKYFMLIDPQMNTIAIPNDCRPLYDALESVGRENVHTHPSQTDLFNEIKAYLKDGGVNGTVQSAQ